jgi:hypothetical protein
MHRASTIRLQLQEVLKLGRCGSQRPTRGDRQSCPFVLLTNKRRIRARDFGLIQKFAKRFHPDRTGTMQVNERAILRDKGIVNGAHRCINYLALIALRQPAFEVANRRIRLIGRQQY